MPRRAARVRVAGAAGEPLGRGGPIMPAIRLTAADLAKLGPDARQAVAETLAARIDLRDTGETA